MGYDETVGIISKQKMMRISAFLFLLAALAFAFTTVRWMAIIESILGIALFAASFRIGPER